MKQLFIFFTVIAVFSGCKKYLDIKPKGYVIPQNVQDFERLLNSEAMIRPLPILLEAFTDDYYLVSFNKNNHLISPVNQAYLWSADVFKTPEDYRYTSFYNLLYANVYQYNAVVNGIDEASGGTIERKAIAKARAKLGRALSYWYLLNLYAKPYSASTASADPGISLVISNDINVKLPGRGTVQACYEFILNDLNEAIPALPLSAADGYQLTKGAGYGFLARTYLMMGRYDKAGEAARAALKTNDKLVDYNSEYTTHQLIGRDFFTWKDNSILFDMLMPENILALSYPPGPDFQVSPLTEQLFDADDLRRAEFNAFLRNNSGTWDGVTYAFFGYLGYAYSIGISTPEMYLVNAEANARAGDIEAAMADINLIRKNRIKKESYTELNASNVKDALKIVLTERRKELLFKGARWFDMRRLNSDPDNGFTAKHYFSDGTYIELPPNSLRYVLQIPEAAINAEIQQNP
jgi:tetratricopeptide (TPR) repeat protein